MMSKAIVMTQAEINQWQREEDIATGPSGIRAKLIDRAKALGEQASQGTVLVCAGNHTVLRVSRHETPEGAEWRTVAGAFIKGLVVRAR